METDTSAVHDTVADPGFPRGGGANSPGGAPTYDFAKFFQKLHEIERIWAPRGGGASLAPPLRSATVIYYLADRFHPPLSFKLEIAYFACVGL